MTAPPSLPTEEELMTQAVQALHDKLKKATSGGGNPVVLTWEQASALLRFLDRAKDAHTALEVEAEQHKTDAEFWKYNADERAKEIAAWNRRAAAARAEPAEEEVERVAQVFCKSGRFETGQGTCAAICMDQLGPVRGRCQHVAKVHGSLARAAIAAMAPTGDAAYWHRHYVEAAKMANEHFQRATAAERVMVERKTEIERLEQEVMLAHGLRAAAEQSAREARERAIEEAAKVLQERLSPFTDLGCMSPDCETALGAIAAIRRLACGEGGK